MKSIVFCRIVVDENHRNEPLQKETARGCPSKTCPAAPMDKPAQTLCRNIEIADRRFSPWKTPLCDNNIDIPAKDRKSTRLNSSHVAISYAVFCLKKKISSISIPQSRM